MVQSSISSFRIYLLGGGGSTITMLAVILFFTWNSIFKNVLNQQLQIKEGSESFEMWRENDLPVYMNFYMFNWLNAEALGDEKPKFSQLGPYSFKVKEKKTGIVWNSNGTITFKIQRFWFFDPEKSNGTLDDEVVTLNSVALSAAAKSRHQDIFKKKALASSMWTINQKLTSREKVGDLLFFGVSEPLINLARTLSFAGIEAPPPFNKFGWFYNRNGTDIREGVFNMETGVNDISSFGKLKFWNYDSKTSYFPSTCSYINGSAGGEVFPPERKKDRIDFFLPDLCRSLYLSYLEEEEVAGIKGFKYVGDKYTFDNGSLDPNNECFCAGKCSPFGVLNATNCLFGSPVFASFPHFYLADNYYLDQVEGLKPEPKKHMLSMTLEPTTGLMLDAAIRFQANLLLSAVEDIGIYENVPTIYFPMMWFESRVSTNEVLINKIKLILWMPFIGLCISTFLIIVGIMMILYAVYLQVRSLQNTDNAEEMKTIENTAAVISSNGNEKTTS